MPAACPHALALGVQYAQWEEGQKDFRRARSVWERALEVSYTNPTTWLKYAEMEMRHRFVNHARNVWDRAVSLLPRVDQLWYKYIHMEEMLGNVPGARQIFERWMSFEPDHHGWMAFIKVRTAQVQLMGGVRLCEDRASFLMSAVQQQESEVHPKAACVPHWQHATSVMPA